MPLGSVERRDAGPSLYAFNVYFCVWLSGVLVAAHRVFIAPCGTSGHSAWTLVEARGLQSTQASAASIHSLACSVTCGILVPQPGINPHPLRCKADS